jgi:hypothetical protein
MKGRRGAPAGAGALVHGETFVLSVKPAPPWVAAVRKSSSWLEAPSTSVLLMPPVLDLLIRPVRDDLSLPAG